MANTSLMHGGTRFGTLTSTLLFPLPWKDDYPSCQEWADELECLLTFADSQGQRTAFLPRIKTNRANQRDEALNELRVAMPLQSNGFPIVAWSPAGLGAMVGEYLVRAPEPVNVFVEVKSPGWESELSHAERLAGRAQLPKHLDGEGGAFANWDGIRKCIKSSKTYAKFSTAQPNLLVIADDFFVSLSDTETQIDIGLYSDRSGYGNETGYFTSPAYRNLGGAAVFGAFVGGKGMVEYKFRVYENRYAASDTKLPKSILALRV
ncbi:MAG: hypothetical protein WCC97_12030 [Candidatus Acidiferrales bacterium]